MKRTITMLALHSVVSMMFAQTCPDSNHPHAIDLGIGVKFACCNVGATSPEQDGGYYAWGEKSDRIIVWFLINTAETINTNDIRI